jgi:hypothetical protein
MTISKKTKKLVIDKADEMVYDLLYFGYDELDDEDVENLAKETKISISEICGILKIQPPIRFKYESTKTSRRHT